MPVRVTLVPLIDKLLLIGPPGIGKTEIIRQKSEERAQKMGRKFVDLTSAPPGRLEEIERVPHKYYLFYRIVAPRLMPEDLGVPVAREGRYVVFMPPRIFRLFGLPGAAGTLFVDELTNVARADQRAVLYSLLQEKELGWDVRLPEDVYVVAAGNPPEVSSDAVLPSAALLSRLTKIEVAPPTVAEWAEYMARREREGRPWDRRTLAYLLTTTARPEESHGELYAPPGSAETLEPFPTPRGWSELAWLMARLRGAPEEVIAELIRGRLGPSVGGKFLGFLRLGEKVPSPKTVIERPEVLKNLGPEELYMALAMTAQYLASSKDVGTATKLAAWLTRNMCEYFPAFMAMLGEMKLPVIRELMKLSRERAVNVGWDQLLKLHKYLVAVG